MPRHCTVCVHPQPQMVHDALVRGQPVRTVARRYGLSKSSVARHWARHRAAARLSESVAGPPPAAEDFDFARTVDQLERLLLKITPPRGVTKSVSMPSPCP